MTAYILWQQLSKRHNWERCGSAIEGYGGRADLDRQIAAIFRSAKAHPDWAARHPDFALSVSEEEHRACAMQEDYSRKPSALPRLFTL